MKPRACQSRRQLALHGEPGEAVELAQRLVEDQQARIVDQRAGERGALRHAARELVRVGLGEFLRGRRARALHRRAALCCCSRPRASRPSEALSPDGAPGIERRILEHDDARRVGAARIGVVDQQTAACAAARGRRPGAAGSTCRSRSGPAARRTRRRGAERSRPRGRAGAGRAGRSRGRRCGRRARRRCMVSSGFSASATIGRAPSARPAGDRAARKRSVISVEHISAMTSSARVHVGVGGPALRPLQIPAEAGFHAQHLGDDQHGEGRAQAHEQADEDVRQRGREWPP